MSKRKSYKWLWTCMCIVLGLWCMALLVSVQVHSIKSGEDIEASYAEPTDTGGKSDSDREDKKTVGDTTSEVKGDSDAKKAESKSVATRSLRSVGAKDGEQTRNAMGGSGTVDDPYLIGTYDQLKEFARIVNAGNSAVCAKLTGNIVCENNAGNTAYATDWVPIGDHHKISDGIYCDYNGTFDGKGFTITGLSTPDGYEGDYAGLFGYVGTGGTVQNVGLEGGHIHSNGDSNRYVGAVVGYNEGIITSCYNTGAVTGTVTQADAYVGGVAGSNFNGTVQNSYNTGAVTGTADYTAYVGGVSGWSNGTITSCYNTGDVSGSGDVGGVVGHNMSTVQNSYNTGKVSGSGNSSVGGVAGCNNVDGIVQNSYNTGSVTGTGDNVGGVVGCNFFGTVQNSYNTGSVTGTGDNVGGVAGSNFNGTVQNSYNTGAVTGTGKTAYVGGVAGQSSGTITSCYNTGAVTGTANQWDAYVGGVAGRNEGTITSCYNTGAVSGTATNGSAYVGGVIGYNSRTVQYCYYDKDVCVVTNPIGGGTTTGEKITSVKALTTAQMTGLNALADENMKFVYGEGEKSPWLVKDDIKVNGKNYWLYPHLKGFLYDTKSYLANWPPRIEVSVTWKNLEDHVYNGSSYSLPTVTKIEVNGAELPETSNYTVTSQKKNANGEWESITVLQDSSDYRAVITFQKYGNKTITENFMIYYEIDRYSGDSTTGSINLKVFASIVNGQDGYEANPNACAKLISSFECGGTDWIPIGDHHKISDGIYCDYNGTFDGKGFTITGLSTPDGYEGDYAGLFGYVGSGGTVQNVGLEGGHIHSNRDSNRYVGAVVGYNEGTIMSCYNTGAVTGTATQAEAYVGGVAGWSGGPITSCYNTGAVSGTATNGIANVGGVVGWSGGPITSCYNTGAVSGTVTGADAYVGGVAGRSNGTITSCYNEGNVSGTVTDRVAYVGGVAGDNSGTITSCYNTGAVTGTATNGTAYVGGVIGYNDNTVQYCYYDKDVCDASKAIGDTDDTGDVKGLTTAQMTYGTWIDGEITSMKGFTADTWLAKVKDVTYAFYPHLKGFNLDKYHQQIPAADIAVMDWPPKNVMSITVTINAIDNGGGSAIQVYYWADDDDESEQDEAYFAQVTSGEYVPRGAVLGISVQLATGYKLDKIEYKMGSATEYSTLDKPFLQCTASLVLQATVSQLTYELTLISDPVDIGAQLTSLPADRTSIAYGAEVTITADNSQVASYTFIGWYDGTKLLTNGTSFTFVMTNAITYTARYVSNANKTVIYMSNDTIYHTDTYSSAPTAVSYPTKNPIPMHGSTFREWDKTEVQIEAELSSSNLVIVTAVFVPLNYQISFIVYDGETKIVDESLNEAAWRTVKAADDDFSHWERSIGGGPREIYSYRKEISLKIVKSTTLYVVYAKQSVAKIRSVRYDTIDESMSIAVDFKVPDGATLVQAGVVADASDQDVTLESATGTKYVQPFPVVEGTTGSPTYTWVLNRVIGDSKSISPGYALYVRGYMMYKKANGQIVTAYGDVYHAVAGLDYDIEDQAVALIESANHVKYDDSTYKVIFVSYISVPDGCTIKKAGVVASSNAKFDPTSAVLTCDNAEYIVESPRAVGKGFILYTWVKKDVVPGTKWYARPYVFYMKGLAEYRVYGALSRVEVPAASNPGGGN